MPKAESNEIPFNETAGKFNPGELVNEEKCEVCGKAKLGPDEEIKGGKLVIGGVELDAPVEIYCSGHK